MDFHAVRYKVTQNEYKDTDTIAMFKDDCVQAIMDECGFNYNQSVVIYAKACLLSNYEYEKIIDNAQKISYFCRKVINLEV